MSEIRKVEALEALAAAGPTSANGFFNELRRRGLSIAGPWHAHTILVRLKRQGLASQEEKSVRLRYAAAAGTEVERRQRAVRWAITDRGASRMAWLARRTRGTRGKVAANPPPKGKKGGRFNR